MPTDQVARTGAQLRLEIDRDGRWYRFARSSRVDLSRRRVLARVLLSLAEQRVTAPGRPATTQELFERAWGGQNIRHESALNRLYVAISSLRQLGLRDVLVSAGDGYLIPVHVEVVLR